MSSRKVSFNKLVFDEGDIHQQGVDDQESLDKN